MEQQIDQITLAFSPESLRLLNICLAFIMYGVALDLQVSDFQRLFQSPKAPLVGLLSQFVLLPALTVLVVIWLKPMPSMAMGMVLVAACPGGNVSNFICSLAKGNLALSVTLTALSSSLAILLTPLNFTFWSSLLPGEGMEALRQSIQLNVANMVVTIVTIIAIPLVLGMLTRRYLPVLTHRIQKPIRILSILVFVGFVVVAFRANFDYFRSYFEYVVVLVFLHNAVALVSGYSLASLFGLNRASRRAVSIETGIQNSGLALIIIFNFFNGLGGMALIAAWWGIWHLISGSVLAYLWNRRPAKASAAATA